MSAARFETCALTYELEIAIEAPPDAVWEALVHRTDAWWLPDFRMLGSDSVVTLEPHAGGQLLEQQPDGASLLWYTVIMCMPGRSLQLVGHLAPEFGGPASSTLQLQISAAAAGAGTLLRVSDALFGRVSEAGAQNQKDGWALLFGDGLKHHLEAA